MYFEAKISVIDLMISFESFVGHQYIFIEFPLIVNQVWSSTACFVPLQNRGVTGISCFATKECEIPLISDAQISHFDKNKILHVFKHCDALKFCRKLRSSFK